MRQMKAVMEFAKPLNQLAGSRPQLGIPLNIARLPGSGGRHKEVIRGAGTVNGVSAYIERILCEQTSNELRDIEIKLFGPTNNPAKIEKATTIEISFVIQASEGIKLRLKNAGYLNRGGRNIFGQFLFHPAGIENLDGVDVLSSWGEPDLLGLKPSGKYESSVPVKISLPIIGISDRKAGPFCLKFSVDIEWMNDDGQSVRSSAKIEVDLPVPYDPDHSVTSEQIRSLGRYFLRFFKPFPALIAADLKDLPDKKAADLIRQASEQTLKEILDNYLSNGDMEGSKKLFELLTYYFPYRVSDFFSQIGISDLAVLLTHLFMRDSVYLLKTVEIDEKKINEVKKAFEAFNGVLPAEQYKKLGRELTHYLADDKFEF